jgi:hypothetical protein
MAFNKGLLPDLNVDKPEPQMTEQEILLEARLVAIERMVCHTYNVTVKILQHATGLTDGAIAESEDESLAELRLLPVSGIGAALSDVLSDEIFRDLSRLIEMSREMRNTEWI